MFGLITIKKRTINSCTNIFVGYVINTQSSASCGYSKNRTKISIKKCKTKVDGKTQLTGICESFRSLWTPLCCLQRGLRQVPNQCRFFRHQSFSSRSDLACKHIIQATQLLKLADTIQLSPNHSHANVMRHEHSV